MKRKSWPTNKKKKIASIVDDDDERHQEKSNDRKRKREKEKKKNKHKTSKNIERAQIQICFDSHSLVCIEIAREKWEKKREREMSKRARSRELGKRNPAALRLLLDKCCKINILNGITFSSWNISIFLMPTFYVHFHLCECTICILYIYAEYRLVATTAAATTRTCYD